MSRKVKIIGAGSIGNHLSYASRRMGWSVDLCDLDSAALARTKTSIYPQRYGAWDENIRLYEAADVPVGGYDLIFIGTTPDHHMDLAIKAITEKPKAVLIEKPLCEPSLEKTQALYDLAKKSGVQVFTGYDHVVGMASLKVSELIGSSKLGEVETIDVEFREFWGGIFNAHPWLEGPKDSYLGYWRRGGGASGEHSHAMNLWQHFAHEVVAGRVVEVQAFLQYVEEGLVNYDKLCLVNVRTEKGLVGRIVQDVVTNPPRKWARIQGNEGYIEWTNGYQVGCDRVMEGSAKEQKEYLFNKTRPDDFIAELKHIDAVLSGSVKHSPIS